MSTSSELQRKRLFLFPFFFMIYELSGNLSTDIYIPAILEVAKDFQITAGFASLSVTVWLLGDACLQWLMGPLADGFGKRNTLTLGGFVFLLGTGLCILSSQFSVFLLGRFLQGVGLCSMMVSGYATVYENYSGEFLVRLLAMLTSASILAPMIGPFLGGYLLEYVSWRFIFGILFFMASGSLVLIYFSFPKEKQKPANKLELSLAFQAYRRLLKNKNFLAYNLCLGFLYACLSTWMTTSPLLLMKSFQLSHKGFGLCQLPIFGAYILGAQIRGRWNQKFPLEKSILGGVSLIFLAASCLSFLSFKGTLTQNSLLTLMSLVGLGVGFVLPVLNKGAFESSVEEKGVTSAMFYMMMILNGTCISFLGVLLSEINIQWVYLLMAFSTLLSFLVYFFGKPRASAS